MNVAFEVGAERWRDCCVRTIASNCEHNSTSSSLENAHTLRFETRIGVVVGLRFGFPNLEFRFLQRSVGWTGGMQVGNTNLEVLLLLLLSFRAGPHGCAKSIDC